MSVKIFSFIQKQILKTLALPEGFKINFFTLKFEKNLESKFRIEYFKDILPHIRFSLLVSIIFYGLFGLLDRFLIPELLQTFLILRFGFVIPFSIIALVLSYFKVFKKLYLPAISLLIFIGGFCIVAMIYLSKDYPLSLVQTSYYTGILLIFIFAYSFVKLRFWWATIPNLLVIIIYEIVAIYFINLPTNYLIITNFFLISANLMGMFSSYINELTHRMNFYHKNLLTEEKAKVENINQQLEDRVYQRTKELEKATDKAIKSDKLKSMFLANISHEIRTPMNGILGFASLLSTDNLSPEKRESYVEIINSRGNYLLEILNNLIDISKIESGSMNINYEEMDLHQSINNLHLFLEGFFTQKNLNFISDIPGDKSELIIRADKIKLEQIITNLVSNASKYAIEGTVVLGYKIENKLLRVFVSDNGPGIPEHFRPFMFKAFAKNENKEEKFNDGTGLGLSISKGLAELMDAELNYTSTIGEGTTFYLDFKTEVIR